MATVVSLTQSKIEELMAGWEGVSLSQDEINALIQQLYTNVESQGANLEHFDNIIRPAIEADVAAASNAVSDVTANIIPDLVNDIDQHQLTLDNLNGVTIPYLQTELNSANDWIVELNDITLPALDASLVDLNDRLVVVEGSTGGFDPTELQAAIDALEGKFPIGTVDIQDGAITADKVEADSITAVHIAAGTITALEIAADTITANEIASHTITAAEIFADTITANEIASDTITANEIAADTITANEIAADTITADEIAADTITANEIATDTITANEIAGDTITANEIATGTITALEIAGGTITGDKIAADTITVSKLIISDLTNLAVDGEFLDPTSANWFEVGPGHMTRVKNSGEPAYMFNTNTYSAQYVYFRNENVFEVHAGDEFFVTLEVSTPASNTVDASFSPYLAVFDQNGGSQLWRGTEEGSVSVPPNTPWTVVQGTVKITESGLATAQFNPIANFGTGVAAGTQEFRIRKVQLRRKNSGRVIIDGTIQGKNLELNTITSDQIDVKTLTGDLFAAELVFAGLMRAGDLDENGAIESGYSEMGARGILTVDTAGETVASFPTNAGDGAFLKAHVELLSAEVKDNFTMRGTNNQIAAEGELTLSSGVEAPSVPPVLQEVYDTIVLNKTQAVPPHTASAGYNMGTFALNPSQITSMTYDTLWNCWVVIQQRAQGFRVWRFTNTGAIFNNFGTGRPWVDDYNDRQHATSAFDTTNSIGGMLFLQGDQWYVWAATQGGTGVINKIPSSWILDAVNSGRFPTLMYIPSNNRWAIVQNNGGGSGTVHIRQFTCNTGANFPNATSQSTFSTEAGSGLGSRLTGAVHGNQTGITGWTIDNELYSSVMVFDGSGVQLNDEGNFRQWSKPSLGLGFCHNGTQFASVDSSGTITLYEDWNWTTADARIWVGAAARDTDTGGTQANPHVGDLPGQHETPVGKMSSITMKRRSKLRITMPETNDSGGLDDPDKWALYFKRGGNLEPTDKTLLKKIAEIGSPTAATSVTITADAIGIAPPGGIQGQATALNNFPGGIPGTIESSKLMADLLPQLQFKGDGTGRWGSLTVDSDGKAVIGGDTGWLAPALVNGNVNYGSPYAPAGYRRIGNVVYLRGLITVGTVFGSANPMFTLPVGFRPGGGVAGSDVFAAGTGSSRVLSIAGDGAKNTSGPDDNITGSTSGHNHTMKSHNHSVTFNITGSVGNVGTRVDIMSDGRVHCPTDPGSWVSLAGISFLVD